MTDRRKPDSLDRAAAILLALEAVALLGAAIAYGIYAVVGDDVEVIPTVGVAAFALLMACCVGATARGFARGSRWSRGAALTWQVLQAAAAAVMIGAMPVPAIALLIASALVAAAAMRASARDNGAVTHSR